MRIRMKQFTKLLLALCLTATMLVGCGAQADQSPSDAPQSSAETESVTGEDTKETQTVSESTVEQKPADDTEEWVLAELILMDAEGRQTNRFIYRYNDRGEYCRQDQYDENDEWSDTYISEYTYLPDGKVSNIHHVNTYLNNGEIWEDVYDKSYSWDPAGRIAYIDTTWASGETKAPEMQVYDNEGRLIESDNGMWQEYRTYSDTERTEKQYWSGLDYTKLTVRKLNGNGDVIEVRTYKADGFTDCTEEDLQEYIVYTRDGEGRTEGYTTYAADGTITRTCTYDYEADGHSYYAELFNGDGNKTGGSHYRYRPISEVTEG